MLADILDSGLSLSIDGTELVVRGPRVLRDELRPTIKRWRPELLKVLAGETVADAGDCDHCGGELLGLLVHGGYTNCVCPHCGEWFRCLPPTTAKPAIPLTTTDLVCNSQPIPLF